MCGVRQHERGHRHDLLVTHAQGLAARHEQFEPWGQLERLAASGAAATSCSTLSSTSNTCLGRRYSSSRLSTDPLPLSDTPSALATAETTSVGSLSAASEMNATPSVN